VSQLQPGQYQLTVSAPGFKKWTASNIPLETGQTAEQNASLALGDTSQ